MCQCVILRLSCFISERCVHITLWCYKISTLHSGHTSSRDAGSERSARMGQRMQRFGSRHNCKQLCKQRSQGMAYLGHALQRQGSRLLARPCFGNLQSKKREVNPKSMSRTDTATLQIYSISKLETWPSEGLLCDSLLLHYAPAPAEMMG